MWGHLKWFLPSYLPCYRVRFRSTFVHSQARGEALDAFVKAVLQGMPGSP